LENLFLQPIEYLKGVGPARAELLKKELNIFSFGDLLQHYPFRYFDRTSFALINEIDSDEKYYQLKGIITSVKTIGDNRQKRFVATLKDASGVCELVWFKGVQWMEKNITAQQEYIIFGRPQLFNNRYNFPHPEIESVKDLNEMEIKSGLFPVYSTTEKLKARGLSSKSFAKIQKALLQQIKPSDAAEFLPPNLIAELKLMLRFEALQQIHFPQNFALQQQAERRLKFEELFLIQLKLLRTKINRHQTTPGFVFEKIDNYFDNFYKNYLPFELTNAQKKVVREIRKDVLCGKQMNRLIQGDVGSGKTIVALLCMLMAVDNGFQACLMAPTEILAQQHFEGISNLLNGLNLKVGILCGSSKISERRAIHQQLESGEINILIGTHALIEDTVQFKNLGIAVVDEQHKFGVQQRAALWKKNTKPPHILVMTATPIPRTLAMTLYGDLDSSVIDELPPGRKPIKTIHKFDSARLYLFGFIKDEIAKGRQVYVVYPLIEESEKLQLKDLMDGYESFSREFPLPNYRLSIVHGKQKAEDKEYEMQKFVKGETQIMVATTVIEVGVNVPNASIMVIESAERFGLSQLHQLRGRVGRGAEQSYCVLMTGNKLGADARKRMKTMCDTNDGFIIAEVDLELRGPGDIEGLQQSGVVNLHIANLAKDQQILQVARDKANELLDADAMLQKPEHQRLLQLINQSNKEAKIWGRIS
jgi:ATP-dependent DNA helicase RecG